MFILNFIFDATYMALPCLDRVIELASSPVESHQTMYRLPSNQCAKNGIVFNTVSTLQAIFQRLVEDGFCNLAPSIIVTAKGMPDLSTRVFLRQLHNAFPQLPVLGLVDWNPSGKSNAFNP